MTNISTTVTFVHTNIKLLKDDTIGVTFDFENIFEIFTLNFPRKISKIDEKSIKSIFLRKI